MVTLYSKRLCEAVWPLLLAVEAAECDGGDEGEDADEERDGEQADLHPVHALRRLDRRAPLEC